LIKRLRDSSRAKPRSIGFGRGRDDDKPTPAMVLVAQVTGLDADATETAVKAGAAAVAFAVSDAEAGKLADGDTSALDAAIKAAGDAVPGLVFAGDVAVPAELVDRMTGLGIDFAIANVEHAPAALIEEEKVALVVRYDQYVERPAFLRALGDLKVDAVVAARATTSNAADALTIYDLMAYKLVAESIRQPALVVADASIRPGDLQALRDAGIDGIVISLAQLGGDVAVGLAPFREAIGKLKIKSRADRASDDQGPFLPRATAKAAAGGGDEDDEDDE
jgi:hypothetical protein